jgi:hypothetical protein
LTGYLTHRLGFIIIDYHFFLLTEYEVIKDQPGDSYYVRAMFDRLPDPQAGPHQLSFRKDDILFIDNTMYNGVPGHWSAWLVDLGKQNLYTKSLVNATFGSGKNVC